MGLISPRAHKAADPGKYPITQVARDMYPALNGIEERFGPTSIHLQVYDGEISIRQAQSMHS